MTDDICIKSHGTDRRILWETRKEKVNRKLKVIVITATKIFDFFFLN